MLVEDSRRDSIGEIGLAALRRRRRRRRRLRRTANGTIKRRVRVRRRGRGGCAAEFLRNMANTVHIGYKAGGGTSKNGLIIDMVIYLTILTNK